MGINLFLIPLAMGSAARLGLMDQPGGRKIHHTPIPRVGGLTILVSLLLTILAGFLFFPVEYCFGNVAQTDKLWVLLIGTCLAAAIGLADDLLDLKPSIKIVIQTLLTCAFALWGYRFEILHVPGFTPIPLIHLSVPFTAFWMMGVMNGFNFMDGIDGLAGSVSMVIILVLGTAATLQADPILWLPMAATLGALIAFLAYNRHPAKIYLGDTGANLLGFLAAAGLIMIGQTNPAGFKSLNPSVVREPFPFQMILCTLMVGYPFMEALLSTMRRSIKKFFFGRSMEWSEKEHIHHRLLKLNWGTTRICAAGVFFSLFMGGAGLMAMTKERALAVFCLLPVVAILTFLMQRMSFFDFLDAESIAGKRTHYQIAHRFLEMQKLKLQLVTSREEILALASQTCAEFGVQGFWIKSEAETDGRGGLLFYWERPQDIQQEYLQFLKTDVSRGDYEVFKDRVSLEEGKIESYWIFEPHSEESDLDVEYRILVGNYMREILRAINRFNIPEDPGAQVQINNLGHARVRSSLLKQRYGPKKGKTKLLGKALINKPV